MMTIYIQWEWLNYCPNVWYFHQSLEMFSCLCTNLLHKLIYVFRFIMKKLWLYFWVVWRKHENLLNKRINLDTNSQNEDSACLYKVLQSYAQLCRFQGMIKILPKDSPLSLRSGKYIFGSFNIVFDVSRSNTQQLIL